MRITKELEAKIKREVNKKFESKREELNAVYNTICNHERIRMKTVILNGLKKQPELTCLVQNYFGFTTLEERVERFLQQNGISTSVTADITKRINDLQAEQALFLENFLINVTYEKDINGIKSLFADFELSF